MLLSQNLLYQFVPSLNGQTSMRIQQMFQFTEIAVDRIGSVRNLEVRVLLIREQVRQVDV